MVDSATHRGFAAELLLVLTPVSKRFPKARVQYCTINMFKEAVLLDLHLFVAISVASRSPYLRPSLRRNKDYILDAGTFPPGRLLAGIADEDQVGQQKTPASRGGFPASRPPPMRLSCQRTACLLNNQPEIAARWLRNGPGGVWEYPPRTTILTRRSVLCRREAYG